MCMTEEPLDGCLRISIGAEPHRLRLFMRFVANAMKRRSVFTGAILMLALSMCALAQTQAGGAQTGGDPQQRPAQSEEAADSNPMQVVFMQIRSEYTNLNGDNWTDALILRSDRVLLKHNRYGGKVGLLTRFDIPLVTAKIGSSTHTGLGDIYIQALQLPLLHRRLGFFVGGGVSIPTATYQTLGTGKWTIGPIAGPLINFKPGHFAFVKVQYGASIAGPSTRRALNFLEVTPLMSWRLPHHRWVLVTAESHTDFKNSNRTWFKGGVQVGRVFSKKVAAWIEPNVFWGGTRPGSFTVRLGIVKNR